MQHFSSIYDIVPAYATLYQHMQHCISICNIVPAYATLYQHIRHCTSICDIVPTYATLYQHMQHFSSICNRHFVSLPSPVTICTRCKFWVISHQINLYWTLFKAEKNKKFAVLCRPWQKLRIRAGYRVLSGGQIYVVGSEQGHLGGARIISCLKWAVLGGCQIYTQTS